MATVSIQSLSRPTIYVHTYKIKSIKSLRSDNKADFYFSYDIECSCRMSDVNKRGLGACRKKLIFKNQTGYVCFVKIPSSCKDIVRSKLDPEKLVSWEACRNRGRQATSHLNISLNFENQFFFISIGLFKLSVILIILT